jgi:hypothetical protein
MGVVATITISTVDYYVYGLTSDAVGDADDYFAAALGAAEWTAATTLQKQQALISAARFLDRALIWSGTATADPQDLKWPRDGATCRSTVITDGTIPDNIVLGEFELALALLKDPDLLTSSTGTGSNIRRAKAGSAEVEYFRPTIGTVGDVRVPRQVWDLVGCYTTAATPTGIGGAWDSGTLDSDGNERTSYFDDCENDFRREEGFR